MAHHRSLIIDNLKESYGRLLYTYETHQKQINLLTLWGGALRWIQIGLTSVSAVGFLRIAITDETTLAWAAGLCSVISLALNLYSRDAGLSERIQRHRNTADCLWGIVQDWRVLLVDCHDDISVAEIERRRDELQARVDHIYREAPRTGHMAYRLARRSLTRGEHEFTTKEIDALLPAEMREWDRRSYDSAPTSEDIGHC